MPGGMYFISFCRYSRPACDCGDIRFDLNFASSSEPPFGHSTRMKLSADCVSPRRDCSANANWFLPAS